MKVALLVGVLMINLLAGFYQMGWLDAGAAPDAAGQVRAFDECFPPPPPPPSWP